MGTGPAETVCGPFLLLLKNQGTRACRGLNLQLGLVEMLSALDDVSLSAAVTIDTEKRLVSNL